MHKILQWSGEAIFIALIKFTCSLERLFSVPLHGNYRAYKVPMWLGEALFLENVAFIKLLWCLGEIHL